MSGDEDKKWREKLTEPQYAVCREGATEPAFSGELLDEKRDGTYFCVCCQTALFTSQSKYNSGSGWPSFFEPINSSVIKETKDTTLGMIRVEIKCANCLSHLGHVFPDGPKPTGMRYCTNSLSLEFKPS